MKGRKMSFQRIFLPLIFLPSFQSDRSKAFFNLIVQFEIFCNSQTAKFASTIALYIASKDHAVLDGTKA